MVDRHAGRRADFNTLSRRLQREIALFIALAALGGICARDSEQSADHNRAATNLIEITRAEAARNRVLY
jgi:hypothetical protein